MILPNCLPDAFHEDAGVVWYKKAISKFDPAWFVVDRNAPRSRPMHSIAPPAFCPSSMPSPVEPGCAIELEVGVLRVVLLDHVRVGREPSRREAYGLRL